MAEILSVVGERNVAYRYDIMVTIEYKLYVYISYFMSTICIHLIIYYYNGYWAMKTVLEPQIGTCIFTSKQNNSSVRK